jgi:hypothetical protein
MNRRAFALTLFAAGVALGLASLNWTKETGTAADFPVRARLPQLAADSASFASPVTGTPSGSATPQSLVLCNVSNVVDGDTIDVNGCADSGRVRLSWSTLPR